MIQIEQNKLIKFYCKLVQSLVRCNKNIRAYTQNIFTLIFSLIWTENYLNFKLK